MHSRYFQVKPHIDYQKNHLLLLSSQTGYNAYCPGEHLLALSHEQLTFPTAKDNSCLVEQSQENLEMNQLFGLLDSLNSLFPICPDDENIYGAEQQKDLIHLS